MIQQHCHNPTLFSAHLRKHWLQTHATWQVLRNSARTELSTVGVATAESL